MSYRKVKTHAAGARALGWISIAIGMTELAAPQKVEDLLGLPDRPLYRGVLRVLGVRELGHGIGLLTAREPDSKLAAGVWSRVAGDVLDTALLGVAAVKTRRPGSFAAVAAVVSAIGVADLMCALKLTEKRDNSYYLARAGRLLSRAA